MTIEDLGKLLGVIAAFDKRTVGKADVAAWYQVVGDLPFTECRDAVLAFQRREGDKMIRPGDVRHAVVSARRGRIDKALSRMRGPDDPDDPQEYIRQIREDREEAANNTRAIGPGRRSPAPPPPEYLEARERIRQQVKGRYGDGVLADHMNAFLDGLAEGRDVALPNTSDDSFNMARHQGYSGRTVETVELPDNEGDG